MRHYHWDLYPYDLESSRSCILSFDDSPYTFIPLDNLERLRYELHRKPPAFSGSSYLANAESSL